VRKLQKTFSGEDALALNWGSSEVRLLSQQQSTPPALPFFCFPGASVDCHAESFRILSCEHFPIELKQAKCGLIFFGLILH